MTTYISGSGNIAGFSGDALQAIELRVISNLLQQQAPNSQQDQLSILRNDEAFGLSITPPVVPGN